MEIQLTRWKGFGLPKGWREAWSWLALVASFAVPAVVADGAKRQGMALATFVDDHRKNANVERLYGIGLDVDACDDVLGVANHWRGCQGVVHTTWSHGYPKLRPDGTEADAARARCRVYLIFSRPITPDEYRRIWPVLAEQAAELPGVKVDGAAKDPARLLCPPCVRSIDSPYERFELEGSALDVDQILADLDAEALADAVIGTVDLVDWPAKARAYIAHRPPAVSGQRGHARLWQVAVDLVRGFALPDDIALGILESDYSPRCDPPWSRAELVHKVEQAKGARAELGYLRREGVSSAPIVHRDAKPENVIVLADGATGGIDLWDAWRMADEPPPTEWICERLHIAPGRPTALTGYAGSGKTMLGMDLLLAVAANGRLEGLTRGVVESCWGGIDVSGERDGLRGAVHLDFEMGEKAIWRRYKAMARARGFDVAELGSLLRWRSYPAFRLNHPDALDGLSRAMGGRRLLLADSLKALLPGVQENDAAMADWCGILGLASERTGCGVLVIHHEGKPPQEGKRSAQYRARGSSAIQGCLSSQWSVSLAGETKEDRHLLLEQGKTEHGEPADPLRVAIVGTVVDGLAYLAIEGRAEPESGPKARPAPQDAAVISGYRDRVLEIMKAWDRIPGYADKRTGKTSPAWIDVGGCSGLRAMARALGVSHDHLRWTWSAMTQGPLDPTTGKRDSTLAVLIDVAGRPDRTVWRLKCPVT